MSGEIATRGAGALALSGEMAELLGDQLGLGDLTQGVNVGFPVLSIKGKVFHIREGGETELVTKPDDETEPATSLEVVLIKANSNVSKVYYDAGFEEGSDSPPTCYSNDGKVPAEDSEEKQCSTCAKCPKNAWGSRITESGKKGKACADSRRVAIAAAGDLERVMLLRVPAASLKPLMQYGQTLTKKGVPYQAIVTKLGFDYTVAHPLLTFKPVRPITVEEARVVKEMIVSDVTEAILHGGNAAQTAAEVAADGVDPELDNAVAGAEAATAVLGETVAAAPVTEPEAPPPAPAPEPAAPKATRTRKAADTPKKEPEAVAPASTPTTNTDMDAELARLLGDGFDN